MGSPVRPGQITRGFHEEWPLQDIFKVRTSYQLDELCLLGRPKWACKGFPGVTDSFFKTIFQITLSYQCNEIGPPKDLDNKCPFQDHFQSKTIYSKTLPPGRPQQWMCTAVFPRVTDEQPLQDHLSSKTNVLTWRSDSWKKCKENMWSREFSSVAGKWPFQDHLWEKLSYQHIKALSSGDLNNEMAFSRPSSE